MARPYRQIDEPRIDFIERKAIQAVRQAGDGTPAHASAEWGNIVGTIELQLDLKEVTDDIEAKATLADDGY